MAITIAKGQIALVDLNDLQAQPNQPSNPTEGSLWLNTLDNQVYVYSNGQWRLSTNYTDYVQSRGENLVTNGTGKLGTNFNFSAFTFDGSDSYFSIGSFKDATYNSNRQTDEVIPVDVSKVYRLNVWAKANPFISGAHAYIGIAEYDADGLSIQSNNHMYIANTLTTLAQSLKPGDTVVYLTSAANWQNAAGTNAQNRSIIFWNYTNSKGYTFPPLTYSRNISAQDIWADGSINFTNNTITLRTAWTGPTYAAGTQLSNGSAGGSYKYIAAGNVNIPNTWTNYTGTIGGIDNTGNNVSSQFSNGTAGVKLLFLNNRDVTGNTTWYSNITFNVDVASQGSVDTVNSYLTDLADDNKISRFERSVVRQMINDITGLWLNPTDNMPTLATIDSSGVGQLYQVRKAARDIGADITPGTNYTNVGNYYTNVANYLNQLSPKPWDTTLTTTASTVIVGTTWNTNWKSFNDAFNLLQIDVQDRQKAYTDAAQQNAINAVQNSVAHQTTTIANPSFTINAPIATLGLPEFQGAHIDSFGWNGRNLILGSYHTLTGANGASYMLKGWSPLVTGAQYFSGQTVTVSCDISYTNGGSGGRAGYEFAVQNSGGTWTYLGAWRNVATAGENWSGRVSATYTVPAGTYTAFSENGIYIQLTNNTCSVSNPKVEIGTKSTTVYSQAPEDWWGAGGNRIKPVTNPKFSTGTSLTMNVAMYGDGTNNDSLVWDNNGNLVKTRKWQDDNLDGTEGWAFGVDSTGYKQVKAAAYAVDVTNSTVQAVKHDGNYLSRVTSFTAADQVALASSDNTLYISISDTDSGWGETYTPTAQEIAAYFLGWRMCNGTYNTNYTAKREVDMLTITHAATAAGNLTIGLNGTNYTIAVANGDSTATIASKISAATFTGYSDSYSGSVVTFTATQDITTAPTFSAGSTGVTATISTTAGDVKQWYPIGDTDTSRITSFVNGVPTTGSPSIGNTKNYYQVVYQVGTPTQVTGYTFNGVLALIQGNNTVNVSYPSYTPSIVTGTVKYATNLATSNQDLTYIIPTIQTRLASAESKVTNNAIINTVTQSTSYQTDLAGKADANSLSNYATQAALSTTNSNVSNLNSTVNGINGQLSTFVTTTQETADIKGVKESFYQSGGMNLAYNSVGYDYNTSTKAINFWTQYSSYNVTTVQNNDLYNLGFGSGFYYTANGQNKGISQDINVVPGQHYTLSWYLNKLTSGGDSTYRFFIQILENGVVVQQIADNSGTKTSGYTSSYMQYTASANITKCTIRFIGYANVEAYISGIMFTIGDTPIQWTLATGESYNTNIRMNINGIVVSQLDANGNETGYTQITPSEFAGYHTSNNGGTFEKVFYLNGDETVTKKITATTAITMGNIQILPISGASNTGWVFIPNN